MKKLLPVLLAIFIIGGCSFSVNFKRPIPSAIETVFAPDVYFEGTQATVNISYLSGMKFKEVMRQVKNRGITHIHLDIYSGGGGLFDMNIYLAEIFRFKREGGTVTSHAAGLIGSAAVPIYLSGDYRTMDHNAWVMLHPHSLHGKALKDFIWTEVEEDNPTDETLFRKAGGYLTHDYAKYVSDRTNLTYEEALKYVTTTNSEQGQYWFSAYESFEMGFANELI
jgi:ATP-dependent protease ClpP protease subunit